MIHDDDQSLRRLALHLVAQLPDDPHRARRVLDYARELVDKFLERPCESHQEAEIIRLP